MARLHNITTQHHPRAVLQLGAKRTRTTQVICMAAPEIMGAIPPSILDTQLFQRLSQHTKCAPWGDARESTLANTLVHHIILERMDWACVLQMRAAVQNICMECWWQRSPLTRGTSSYELDDSVCACSSCYAANTEHGH